MNVRMGFGELTEMCGQSVLCQDRQCSDTEFIFISHGNLVLLHMSGHDLILPAKGQGILVKGLSGGGKGSLPTGAVEQSDAKLFF